MCTKCSGDTDTYQIALIVSAAVLVPILLFYFLCKALWRNSTSQQSFLGLRFTRFQLHGVKEWKVWQWFIKMKLRLEAAQEQYDLYMNMLKIIVRYVMPNQFANHHVS